MRNYLDLLGLHRDSDQNAKLARIEALEAELEPDYVSDITSVLCNDTRNTHYRRLHLQYDAMAATLNRGVPQQDSNSWSKRLVEFSPDPNELPD